MQLTAWPALLVSGLIVVSLLLKAGLEPADLPDLLGYLLLGVGLRIADEAWCLLPPEAIRLLSFLAEVGIVTLLFRIGLSLDPTSLSGHGPTVALLLGAAVVGKGLGSFLPALRILVPTEATVLAVSLLPRSESTLLVLQRGLALNAVPASVFGPVVAVVIVTMVGASHAEIPAPVKQCGDPSITNVYRGRFVGVQ